VWVCWTVSDGLRDPVGGDPLNVSVVLVAEGVPIETVGLAVVY
jgi:hypothetical protein